jgi:hypothetical protein
MAATARAAAFCVDLRPRAAGPDWPEAFAAAARCLTFDSGLERLYTTPIPRSGANQICCGYGIEDAVDVGLHAPEWSVEFLERAARRKEFVHA